MLAELGRYQDAETLGAAEEIALVPVLPLEIEKDGLRLSLFTVIATFGTAQDVTADELRIGELLPRRRGDPEKLVALSAAAASSVPARRS